MILLAAAPISAAADTRLELGRWEIVNTDDNTLNLSFDGNEAIKKAYSEVTYRISGAGDSKSINTTSLAPASVSLVDFSDEIGSGKSLIRVYNDGTATLTHTLNLYHNEPYAIAGVSVSPNAEGAVIESNYMVALASDTRTQIPVGTSHSMLWVPFDNDCHGRYEVHDCSKELTSHEVACVFDMTTGFGFVAGSVDHDKWKSGITVKGSYRRFIDNFKLQSGYTSKLTRDFDWETQTVTPHGYVKGTTVSSARYLVGFFDDWRVGMESFAEACAKVVPPAPWEGGNPMGWSSWGIMQINVNFDAVRETQEWIKSNLYNLGFHDKYGQTVVSLDSYAEDICFTQSDMSRLGNKILGSGTYTEGFVKKEGLNMRLGLYGGIAIWDWGLDYQIAGTGVNGIPAYIWRDALLKNNGHMHRLVDGGSYCAIDPTHPAVKANIEHTLSRWVRFNVKYIKMDFISSAICEGDSWYDPEITTGVMAYNYAMKMLYECAEKYDMYILEGISPLFPYQWAHARRDCCDSFSLLAESEYVMNAMSWGWWTDRLYAVNDPDHLVLHNKGYNLRETEGENRVRVTSGVCSGAFIIGDSFSDKCVYTDNDANGYPKGGVVAYPEESKARALKMFGNADINAYVRENTGSFRPIGDKYTSLKQSFSLFMRDTPNYVYVAVFNFDAYNPQSGAVQYENIGIEASNVKEIKELWTGETVTPSADYFYYKVPKGDARIYRITKSVSSVGEIVNDDNTKPALSAVIAAGQCVVAASSDIDIVTVYDLSGRVVAQVADIHHVQAVFDINARSGVYIVEARMEDGTVQTIKVENK